jgi:hypothetical protein
MAWNTGGPLGQQHELGPTLTSASKLTIKLKPASTFDPTAMMGMGLVDSWGWNAATRELTVVGYPRSASWTNAACDPTPGGCNVQTADFDVNNIFMFNVFDMDPSAAPPEFQAIAQQFQLNLFGGHISTNAQAFTPPDYNATTGKLEFTVGAAHCRAAGPGCTLNTGFFNAFIPNTFIQNIWNVDPATLTASNTQVTIEGQLTATPAVSSVAATSTSPAGKLISYSGFTFSAPKIEIATVSSVAAAPPEISLPTTNTGGPVSSAILPVRISSSGLIPVALTVSETARGAKGVFASGTKVTRRSSGAAFSGLLYTPAAIEDPSGGKLSSATSFGAEGLIREAASDLALSMPMTLTLPVPAGADAAKLQPARLTSSGSLVYLLGSNAGGSVSVETDRLGVYGLAPLSNAGVIDDALQLPSSGTITDAIAMSAAGARLDLAAGTALTAAGSAFAGELAKPAAAADPTKGALSSIISFGAGGTEIKLSRAATITLPVPSGADRSSLQPVAVDAQGRLTYLLGRAASGGIAFETDHLSTFALAAVARPAVRTVDRGSIREPGFHARWTGQSDRVELAAGQLVDLAVRLVNAGDRAWVNGSTGAQVRLGSSAPLDNTRDFDGGVLVAPLAGTQNRYAEPDAAEVGPGALGTFAMRLRAPSAMGAYRIYLRPVVEGVTWMEDEGIYLEIVVK